MSVGCAASIGIELSVINNPMQINLSKCYSDCSLIIMECSDDIFAANHLLRREDADTKSTDADIDANVDLPFSFHSTIMKPINVQRCRAFIGQFNSKHKMTWPFNFQFVPNETKSQHNPFFAHFNGRSFGMNSTI